MGKWVKVVICADGILILANTLAKILRGLVFHFFHYQIRLQFPLNKKVIEAFFIFSSTVVLQFSFLSSLMDQVFNLR